MTWLLPFVLNLRDNFLSRRNILATNQIARKTIEPFENNNKRSQGRLGEGGPLSTKTLVAIFSAVAQQACALRDSALSGEE